MYTEKMKGGGTTHSVSYFLDRCTPYLHGAVQHIL